jgi:hypothetical protein
VKKSFVAFFSFVAAASAAVAPLDFQVGAFSFARPDGWGWVVPASPMRKAQLEFSAPDGTKAETVFFHFGPGQGGGVDANVKRWFSQFPDSKTGQSESIVGGVRVVHVDAEGTFLSGMPGTEPVPLAGYALRGAILEDPSGGDVFVKMTGPAAAVAAARPSFDEMVSAAAGSLSAAPR